MASAVGIVLILTMVAWLGIWGPVNLDAIQQWQALIGGMIAFLGIIGAALNVSRQLRMAARGREQDRIERELPGLRAAATLLERFSSAMAKKSAAKVLAEFEKDNLNLRLSRSEFVHRVGGLLPLTPDSVWRELALRLHRLSRAALEVGKADEDSKVAEFMQAIAALEEYREELGRRVIAEARMAEKLRQAFAKWIAVDD